MIIELFSPLSVVRSQLIIDKKINGAKESQLKYTKQRNWMRTLRFPGKCDKKVNSVTSKTAAEHAGNRMRATVRQGLTVHQV